MRKYNLWPLGIFVFFMIMFMMIVLTVTIAIKIKPEPDNSYFSNKAIIDKSINHIMQEQVFLEKKYDFLISNLTNTRKLQRRTSKDSEGFEVVNNMRLKLIVRPKDGGELMGKRIGLRALLTKFTTSKEDMTLEFSETSMGEFISPEFSLSKGEWKIIAEFLLEGKKAYLEYHLSSP